MPGGLAWEPAHTPLRQPYEGGPCTLPRSIQIVSWEGGVPGKADVSCGPQCDVGESMRACMARRGRPTSPVRARLHRDWCSDHSSITMHVCQVRSGGSAVSWQCCCCSTWPSQGSQQLDAHTVTATEGAHMLPSTCQSSACQASASARGSFRDASASDLFTTPAYMHACCTRQVGQGVHAV